MVSKVLLLSHFNYSQAGPVHGPVDTLGSYLQRKKIPYIYIGYPLYSGERSLLTKFNGKKENKKKFSTSLKLPLILKSVLETWYTLHFLSKNRQDIIIAIDPLNALAAIIAKKVGFVKMVVFYTVDYTPSRFSNRLLNNLFHRIDNFCIKNADEVWNVSNRIVEKRQEQGVEKSHNRYVPNSPSLKVAKLLPDSKVDRFNIMMVTGITHSPAFSMVIEAVSALIDKYPKIKLSLIGTGSYESQLKDKINNSRLKGYVEFLGQLDHERLLRILSRGGIGLAIYTADYSWINYGDSMKAREYMLCGLPTIITDVVSTAEDVERFNAGIVIKANSKDLKKALTKLIANEKFWLDCRQNAIELSKAFDMDRILKGAFADFEHRI